MTAEEVFEEEYGKDYLVIVVNTKNKPSPTPTTEGSIV